MESPSFPQEMFSIKEAIKPIIHRTPASIKLIEKCDPLYVRLFEKAKERGLDKITWSRQP